MADCESRNGDRPCTLPAEYFVTPPWMSTSIQMCPKHLRVFINALTIGNIQFTKPDEIIIRPI